MSIMRRSACVPLRSRTASSCLTASRSICAAFGKHEDADLRGRGLDLVTIKRDYECMKWIGANCFRTSHYPYAD